MRRLKRIFLTSRRDPVPSSGEVRDAVDEKLADFLAGLGLEVIILPNHPANFKRALASLKPDGIVLSGGNDVDPKRYRSKGPARNVSRDRDAVELEAVRWCKARRLPLVGICRGLQLVNVAFGGTLSHDLGGKGPSHVAVSHDVRFTEDFPLPRWRGKRARVNSFHNHGVAPWDLARGLKAMALSPDGLIEALRHPTLPIFAVQWHPERKGSPTALDKALFKAALLGKRTK